MAEVQKLVPAVSPVNCNGNIFSELSRIKGRELGTFQNIVTNIFKNLVNFSYFVQLCTVVPENGHLTELLSVLVCCANAF